MHLKLKVFPTKAREFVQGHLGEVGLVSLARRLSVSRTLRREASGKRTIRKVLEKSTSGPVI